MSLRIPSSLPPDDASGVAPDPGAPPALNTNASGGGFFTNVEPEPKSRVTGPVLLAIVVVTAAGVLLAMRQMGLGPSMSFLDVKIDYPLEGEGAKSKDHMRILTDLKDTEVAQVPLEDIQMNPFEWKVRTTAEIAPQESGPDPAELSRREAELRLTSALARLELNSVMAGRVPMARVSERLVRVGDTLEGMFKVTEITGRSVILTAGDRTFTLTLSDGSEEPPPRPGARKPGGRPPTAPPRR